MTSPLVLSFDDHRRIATRTLNMSHSHCGDESHDHDHGGGGHHSHSPPPDAIPGDSLYGKIDLDRVRCLNEREDGAARKIIKPWDKRLDEEQVFIFAFFLTLTSGPFK